MTEATTMNAVNATAPSSVDVSSITQSPDSLRDVAARVDQALTEVPVTFEQRAERLRGLLDGITGIELGAHERTRLMLQLAYGDCLYVLSTEKGRQELVLAMNDRKITKAKKDENSFLPIVKTIWGRYVVEPADEQKGAPKEVWKHNRSAEKYAGVFRYLLENNVPPNQVAHFIENYNDEKHGMKINGIIAADRANHGGIGTRKVAITNGDTEKLIASNRMKAFSTVEKPDFIKATDGSVVIIARVVDGQLELLGDLKVNNKAIDEGVADLAKRLGVPTEGEVKKAADELGNDFADQFGDLSRFKEVPWTASENGAIVA